MMQLHYFKSLLFTLVLVFSFSFRSTAQSPLDQRINQLVYAMTTQEKINQLINSSFGGTPSNNRLGIPGLTMDDGPHGVRFAANRNGRTATAFPTGIAMAATWDKGVSLSVGQAMGVEFWAFNRNQQLGPCIDICRDPRGGRSSESGGEDSYLAGQVGKFEAIGIQQSPVIATAKHFMGESMQSDRHNMDVIATDRWLMDFSGYNFRTLVQDAGVMCVMGSYNKINGDKGCESYASLTTRLRDRWGFPFYVVSDWGAVWDSQKALKAGTEICMGSDNYANNLPGLVANGQVSEDDLDKAVKRVLKTKILAGMLDYFPVGNATDAKTAEINATNKLAAQKSVILLKNENSTSGIPILPLKKTGMKIALIGPNAAAENLNCYGSSETFPPYAISVKSGIEAKVGAANVTYVIGCDINSDSKTGFTSALTAAANSDVVIFAGGLDATQEGEGYGTGTDRKSGSIDLPGLQIKLIQQLASVNPNLVVVIQSGGVCSLNPCISTIKGLVYSFYAAQEAGNAIADVLFGDYNPAGRMPVTMPKQVSDFPAWSEDSFRHFTDNLDGGYRWFDEHNLTPEFVFGFGLSYTKFQYSNMKVTDATVSGQPIDVSVEIKNTGAVAGEEVAQLYLSCPSAPELWMPKKELRGFERVALQPGETKTVIFHLCADDFYFWNGTQYQAQSGNFTIRVGGSSDNLPLSKNILLVDGEQKPDLKITQIYTMPRYPLVGQEVSFYALVKNQGNTMNNSNSPFTIDFTIDGVKVASSANVTSEIAPGQVRLINSTGIWNPDQIKKSLLSGDLAFIAGTSAEWDATNNTFSRDFEVFDPQVDPKINNLAYQKPVTTSSDYGTNVASNLVDGDLTSRWESARTENESVIIDLQANAELKKFTIYWEGAFAKSYKIESSLNKTEWTTLENITAGAGGTESYSVNNVHGRYIRISCFERTSINGVKYGFSIFEVVVNGNILQSFPDVKIAAAESQLYLPYAKTILDGTLSGGAINKQKLDYFWTQVSGPAGAVIKDPASALTIVKFISEGTYVFRLTGTNNSGSNSADITISVQSPRTDSNLALMKPTICSGFESGTYSASMAVDGNVATRWASAWLDGQWWQVDLQHQVRPGAIQIIWETAYASNFNIQISPDGKSWQNYYSNTAFNGGTITIENLNSLSGRYLKVNCVKRATDYGSSFYSFSLNGNFVNSTNLVPHADAGSTGNFSGLGSLNGNVSSDADNDQFVYYWDQLAGPSTAVIVNPSAAVTTVSELKQGDYYFKLSVDDGKDIDFDVVKIVSELNTELLNPASNKNISIYPNPVGNMILISNPNNIPFDRIDIYDLTGKLIKTFIGLIRKVIINDISAGMYVLKISSDKNSIANFLLLKNSKVD